MLKKPQEFCVYTCLIVLSPKIAVQDDGDVFEIYTAPENFEAVSEAVKAAKIEPQAAEISMIPQNYIRLEGDDAKKMLKLYEAVEDNDDVQNVYANFDIDESEML